MLWAGQIPFISVIFVEELGDFLDGIDFPVIVEGKSDEEALEDFDIKNIVQLRGRPLYKVALSLKGHKEVLVLTDFDREGKKIAAKLNGFLEQFGVVPKNSLRRKIKNIITKKGVSQIENIS